MYKRFLEIFLENLVHKYIIDLYFSYAINIQFQTKFTNVTVLKILKTKISKNTALKHISRHLQVSS